MLVLMASAQKYKYYKDERKMLVVDFPFRFYVLFDVDDDIKSVNTDTEFMMFDSLSDALEIADNRSILKPMLP